MAFITTGLADRPGECDINTALVTRIVTADVGGGTDQLRIHFVGGETLVYVIPHGVALALRREIRDAARDTR
jgi:hypothetical protein